MPSLLSLVPAWKRQNVLAPACGITPPPFAAWVGVPSVPNLTRHTSITPVDITTHLKTVPGD